MLPADAKVTTEMLWRGALILALIDVVFVSILALRLKRERFRRLKWALFVSAAAFWFAVWALMSSCFWDAVYHYVFPHWARWVIPPVYGVLFGAVALLFWRLALRLPGNAVLSFCVFGGLLGMATHIWAVYRGILDKPPLLQGASPVAAVIMPIFEFMLYWCIILSIANLLRHGWERSKRGVQTPPQDAGGATGT
ncbi:MAG TPA: hypothetical protein VMV94_17435 [Phycisphaerae bacterium]|nr:hypothetical protein [Phycisphaerae bacterium]